MQKKFMPEVRFRLLFAGFKVHQPGKANQHQHFFYIVRNSPTVKEYFAPLLLAILITLALASWSYHYINPINLLLYMVVGGLLVACVMSELVSTGPIIKVLLAYLAFAANDICFQVLPTELMKGEGIAVYSLTGLVATGTCVIIIFFSLFRSSIRSAIAGSLLFAVLGGAHVWIASLLASGQYQWHH